MTEVRGRIFKDIRRYKILPDEEQRELLRKYKETGDITAAEKVIKSNIRYFISAIKRYSGGRITNTHPDFLDILQDVMVQVYKCFDKYDPEQAGIRVFANLPIKSAVYYWLRKYKNSKESLTSTGDIYALDEPTRTSGHERAEAKSLYKMMTERVSSRDKYVAHRYYVDNASLREISDEFGISTERARQLRNRAISGARRSKAYRSEVYGKYSKRNRTTTTCDSGSSIDK